MLVVEVLNVTGVNEIAGYKYEVWVTTKTGRKKIIAEGEIGGHKRSDGWRALMQRILDESRDIG